MAGQDIWNMAQNDPLGAGGAAPGGMPLQAAPGVNLNQPFIGSPGPVLKAPTISSKLLELGLAMIAADQAGLGLGGSIAAGLKAYNKVDEDHDKKAREARADRLAEWDVLSRIKERQVTEQERLRKYTALDAFKKQNPDLADLADLDPEQAIKAALQKRSPEMPFGGTSMDAQTANILLKGDPASAEYKAAYNMAAQKKTALGPDGSLQTITPDMSAYRKPIGQTGDAEQYGAAGGLDLGNPELSRIEGMDIVEGARPSQQDAKVVKEITEAHKNINALMEKRKELVARDGTPVAGSQAAMDIDQNTAQLALKIKALEQTGALDAGSVDVMMKAIGDPVIRGIEDFTEPFSGISKSISKFKGGKRLQDRQTQSGQDYIDNTLNSALATRGYKMKSPVAPDLGGAGSTVSAPVDAPTDPLGQPALAPPAGGAAPAQPKTRAEFEALPRGASFINPKDGKIMRKK